MAVSFHKYEGTGNDFVLVDERDRAAPSLPVATRVWLCDRRRGVGADGVLTVLAPVSPGAVATMHLTNADGSVAEMCGNGIRCVARFLKDAGLDQDAFVVDSGAGPMPLSLVGDDVRVDMGPARFVSPRQFPRPLAREAPHAGLPRATTVGMGNPHVVLEVDAIPPADELRRVGRALELDAALFPERVNVEWATVDDDGVHVAVWERGVGLTDACGTGACAAVAALVKAGRVAADSEVKTHLPGGPLRIVVPANASASVFMTGPARRVFVGLCHPPA